MDIKVLPKTVVAGGGGYPAAGIGGGGAGGGGGTCCAGAGGFSGGAAEESMRKNSYTYCTDKSKGTNGLSGKYDSEYMSGGSNYSRLFSGGGYYEGPYIRTDKVSPYTTLTGTFTGSNYYRSTLVNASNQPIENSLVNTVTQTLGGCIGLGWRGKCAYGTGNNTIYFKIGTHNNAHTGTHIGGSGGTAGAGGNITVGKNCKIYAYNGNLSATNSEQSIIYLQGGVQNTRYTIEHFCINSAYEFKKVYDGTSSASVTKYTNSKVNGSKVLNICVNNVPKTKSFNYNGQGVGSGAGYIEESNGTYKVK